MGAMLKLAHTLELEVEECYVCGTPWGMQRQFLTNRRADKKEFFCPMGHPQHYVGETEAERLKAALQQKEKELSALRVSEQRTWEELTTVKQERAQARREATRLKKKAARGECPCCRREFVDVGRHMLLQHPGFVAAAEKEDLRP